MKEKESLLEAIRTFAGYYISYFNDLNEKIKKLKEYFMDIADGKVNIPGYEDNREEVLEKLKEFIVKFDDVSSPLIKTLQVFIDQPNHENLQAFRNSMENGLNVDDISAEIGTISNKMIDQLNDMRINLDNAIKHNSYRR